MSAVETSEWEGCVLEPRPDKALQAELRRANGFVPPLVPFFTDCPWLARALSQLNGFALGLRHVDSETRDLVGLVVSQDNSCRYCYAVQRTLMRAQGYGEQRIRMLERDFFAAQTEPRVRAALEFARRISRCDPGPGGADRAALRAAGWSGDAIRELAIAACANVFLNRIATLPALPVERLERMSHHWILTLAAPFSALRLRTLRARARRAPIRAARREGAWSGLVAALDGTRTAEVVASLIDAALASPLLAPRSKGLALAVIARGLGDVRSEREVLAWLAAQGGSADEIERVIGNLGGAGLDPVDAAVVLFARETIRYEPARIQRLARELARSLPHPAFVELIGVTALGNMISRLGLALEAP